jgi:hypothetical protein
VHCGVAVKPGYQITHTCFLAGQELVTVDPELKNLPAIATKIRDIPTPSNAVCLTTDLCGAARTLQMCSGCRSKGNAAVFF